MKIWLEDLHSTKYIGTDEYIFSNIQPEPIGDFNTLNMIIIIQPYGMLLLNNNRSLAYTDQYVNSFKVA